MLSDLRSKGFLFMAFLQHIRKYGSAFLNSDGGVLMAGILDNGELFFKE